MFIDSHCHLDGHRFDGDRAEALARARQAGVEILVAVGTGDGPGTLDCAVKLVEQFDPPAADTPAPSNADRRPATGFPRIYATVGIHPHEAKLAGEEDFAQLALLARHPRVLAWGEIGLDYYYDHSPREVQQAVFLRQLEMAQAARLPIVIHCRPSANSHNAWDDLISLLRLHWAQCALGGVLHCFTGELEHARAAPEIGFMISFAGNVTFPKAENIRQAAQILPLDRILIETDSPFLAPVPHRGKRNEPAFVVEVARQIAELRGAAGEQIGQATSENFHRFFRLPNPTFR